MRHLAELSEPYCIKFFYNLAIVQRFDQLLSQRTTNTLVRIKKRMAAAIAKSDTPLC
jgi:hypothetical protein